jgi:hypothetical protein
MKPPNKPLLWLILSTLGATVISLPQAWAQTQGQNTVWKNATTKAGSSAYIDASVFGSTSTDLCFDIYSALNSVGSPAGVVIDARGINTGNSTKDSDNNLECASGTTPWYRGGTILTTPASILLPSGTIDISTTWVLPNRTRVFGEAMNSYGLTSGGNGTSIAWTTSGSGPMIQFGGLQSGTQLCPTVNSAPVCTGISFQDVYLYGDGQNIVGIENDYAQDLSYVDHVSFSSIGGTGLKVTANGSGPYSNLSCVSNAKSSAYPMACVELQASNTLGLHGMTATPSVNPPVPIQPEVAIYLDGSNNTIEDIHTEGFADGVRVGQNAASYADTLLDVNAGDGAGSVTNDIHICGADVPPSPAAACSSPYFTVEDLSIVGSLSVHVAGGGNTITATLQDDVTGVWLEQPTNTSSVGLYLLGDLDTIGSVHAYSRFTTSPYTTSPQITPTWSVGSGTPTTGAACSNPGSLYTNTGTGSTLYVCVPGSGAGTGWQPVV